MDIEGYLNKKTNLYPLLRTSSTDVGAFPSSYSGSPATSSEPVRYRTAKNEERLIGERMGITVTEILFFRPATTIARKTKAVVDGRSIILHSRMNPSEDLYQKWFGEWQHEESTT